MKKGLVTGIIVLFLGVGFQPDFKMIDMPITTRKQVEECYQTAKKYLNRLNIGNKHLLM